MSCPDCTNNGDCATCPKRAQDEREEVFVCPQGRYVELLINKRFTLLPAEDLFTILADPPPELEDVREWRKFGAKRGADGIYQHVIWEREK